MRSLSAIAFVVLTACTSEASYTPDRLAHISYDTLIARAHRFTHPDTNTWVVKDPNGEVLTADSLQRIRNPEEYAITYYGDASGRVTEIVLRPGATDAERERQRALTRAINEGPELRRVAIDCSNKVNLLQEVFDRDQANRGFDSVSRRINHENWEIITSFIETCGIPARSEVSEEQMAGIWAVLQHAPTRYRKPHLPALQAAAERGDLHWGTVAMLTDRTLLDEGEPQVYGTQLVRNPATGQMELGQLADPSGVDARRASRGMEPLANYLTVFGLTFDVPQQ